MISTPSRLLLGKRKFSLLVSSNDMKRLMHQQLHKPKAAFDSWSLNIIYQLAWHERHERIDATRQRDPRLFLAFFSNGMWNGERLLANNLQSLSSSQLVKQDFYGLCDLNLCFSQMLLVINVLPPPCISSLFSFRFGLVRLARLGYYI